MHRGAFIEFRVDTVERADGTRATRDFAGHPGAVAIVALDAAGRVALVRQWRLAADDALLEIPAGGLDLHDDGSKEDPDRAAERELEEETGLRAGRMEPLAEFFTTPGFCDEKMHVFRASALTEGPARPEADERIELRWFTPAEVEAALVDGTIREGKTLVALLLEQRRRQAAR